MKFVLTLLAALIAILSLASPVNAGAGGTTEPTEVTIEETVPSTLVDVASAEEGMDEDDEDYPEFGGDDDDF
jgi:hypothetical protein